MNWHRIEASWKQLKEKSVFHWEQFRPDNRNSVDLVDSAPAREGQSDAKTTGFCPDDYVRRSEFSLHIGC